MAPVVPLLFYQVICQTGTPHKYREYWKNQPSITMQDDILAHISSQQHLHTSNPIFSVQLRHIILYDRTTDRGSTHRACDIIERLKNVHLGIIKQTFAATYSAFCCTL